LDDLDQVLTALKRGESFHIILRRMITDTISLIEEHLEKIMKESESSDENIIIRVFGKYLRFWKTMEMLRDEEFIRRRDLVVLVFNEHVKELDEYVSYDLLSYVNRGKQDISPKTQTTETQPPKIEENKVQDVQDGKEYEQEVVSFMLSESLDSIFVSASSARVRIAFDRLLSDPKFKTQRQWVENYIKLKRLYAKKEQLVAIITSLVNEKNSLTSELSNLIVNAAKWKDEMGPEAYETRKNRVLLAEGSVETEINKTQVKIDKYNNEILLLKQTQKQMKIGMNEYTHYLPSYKI